jgi:hypothetical protein
MFCAPGLIFGSSQGVESRFPILRSRTHFRRYRGRLVPFSCFACPDSFSAVRRASRTVFLFCAPEIVFAVLWVSGTIFLFCAPRIVFAVPRASGPVFMFCAHFIVLGGTEGVGSRFHVLRYRNRFWRCLGPRAPFPCFAVPGTFSEARRA